LRSNFILDEIHHKFNGNFKTVKNVWFMYVAGFRIADIERLISAVPIRLACKFQIKCDNIICQMERKLLHISFIHFALRKFPPRLQQIINANNIFKFMVQLNFHNEQIKAVTHTHYLLFKSL